MFAAHNTRRQSLVAAKANAGAASVTPEAKFMV
jgi:hypothetical protein